MIFFYFWVFWAKFVEPVFAYHKVDIFWNWQHHTFSICLYKYWFMWMLEKAIASNLDATKIFKHIHIDKESQKYGIFVKHKKTVYIIISSHALINLNHSSLNAQQWQNFLLFCPNIFGKHCSWNSFCVSHWHQYHNSCISHKSWAFLSLMTESQPWKMQPKWKISHVPLFLHVIVSQTNLHDLTLDTRSSSLQVGQSPAHSLEHSTRL